MTADKKRPLLVKMNRACDVSMILSEGAKLAELSPVKIARTDLSPSERKIRALLLKTCWELIRDGTERKSIRIPANSLVVDGVKYGQVVNGEFLKCDSVSSSVNSHEQCDSGLERDNSPSPAFANTDHPTILDLSSNDCAVSAEPVSAESASLVPTQATNPNVTDLL